MKIEGYTEIIKEEYKTGSKQTASFVDETGKFFYFKKNQVFPIKIPTKLGYAHIDGAGSIVISTNTTQIGIIGSLELEEFRDKVIPRAMEVRDGN